MDTILKFGETEINLEGILIAGFFFCLGCLISLLWSLHVINKLDRTFLEAHNRIIDESITFVNQVGSVAKLDVSEAIKMFEGLKKV